MHARKLVRFETLPSSMIFFLSCEMKILLSAVASSVLRDHSYQTLATFNYTVQLDEQSSLDNLEVLLCKKIKDWKVW